MVVREKMSKDEVKTTLGNALLAFQVCLALWQTLKLTPLGAVVQGVIGWALQPLGLSPAYTRLQCLPGRVFKTVHYFYVLENNILSSHGWVNYDEIRLPYLGVDYHLERRATDSDKNMLFVNGKMCYYITQLIWKQLAFTAGTIVEALALDQSQAPNAVFLKNYKEIWEHVATGRDMTFEEVLDCLILDSQTLKRQMGSSLLLPVDLSVSEEKLLKVLNLAGLFLQTKKVHWLIPTALTLISTVLEFSTPLRKWIYDNINMLFCYAVHLACDPLPRSMRRQIYGLGKLVENLKPSNDVKLKVTRGNITAIIAGGAKVQREGALTLVPLFSLEEGATQMRFHYDNIEIKCRYVSTGESSGYCLIQATTFDEISLVCNSRLHFLSALTLVSSIAKNGCGSLISYAPSHHVRVRGLSQSLFTYTFHAFPRVYEMKLENVIVN